MGMMSVTHGIKWVHFPTKIISASASRVKHLFLCNIVMNISKCQSNFHFYPINKNNSCKYGSNSSNNGCLAITNTINNHGYGYKCKDMTPNKPQYFHRSIQSILQFMNGLNLHVVQLISFTICRVAQIFLTKLKNCQNYLDFSGIFGKMTTRV